MREEKRERKDAVAKRTEYTCLCHLYCCTKSQANKKRRKKGSEREREAIS